MLSPYYNQFKIIKLSRPFRHITNNTPKWSRDIKRYLIRSKKLMVCITPFLLETGLIRT